MAIAQVVGHRPGTIRGIVGTILGITILGGTGTIRSTIPLGTVGVILGITLLGIRLATIVHCMLVEATSVAEVATGLPMCVTTTVVTITLTVVDVMVRAQGLAM